MADADSSAVIYIIIESQMETLHTISTVKSKSHFRLRSVLILAGIVIAIICSLVSLKGVRSVEGAEARTLVSIETPIHASTNLLVKVASVVSP